MNTADLHIPQPIQKIVTNLGFVLDTIQPHILGERFLMRAVTTKSGHKWVLIGKRKEDGVRVVLKISSDARGKQEMEHERLCRGVLTEIEFAYGLFTLPEELLYKDVHGTLVAVHRFIEQEMSFLERPVEEQFTLALSAFKAQESAHATTYEHEQLVRRTFGAKWSADYLKLFRSFMRTIEAQPTTTHVQRTLLADTLEDLEAYATVIDQYGGFLTHTDFVPHNFRIADGKVFLLDASSLRFGNKYEGWARFLNFMTLHNPKLERAFRIYVHANRTEEESIALRMMRLYRLGEIWTYYVGTLERSSGDLLELNTARTVFWSSVLEEVLRGEDVPQSTIDTYIAIRDRLRSEDEKRRQQGLH